jgi:hypothetical protein
MRREVSASAFLALTVLLCFDLSYFIPRAAQHARGAAPARALPPLADVSRAWASLGSWALAPDDTDAPYLPYQAVSISVGNGERYIDGCGDARARESVLRLRWRFNGSSAPPVPPFPRWSRAATCAALAGGTVVVMGDSMSGEFYDALVSSLWDEGLSRGDRQPWVAACGGGNAATVNLTFFNTNFGVPIFSRGTTILEENAAAVARARADPGGELFPLGAELAYARAVGEYAGATRSGAPLFFVLNRGAWMNFLGPRDAGVTDAAVAAVHLRQVLGFLGSLREALPAARVFWRTTTVGHPYCQDTLNAPPLRERNGAAAYAAAAKDAGNSHYEDRFRWDFMFALDAVTLDALPEGVIPMDVAPATALRHDSHPHFKYKHRERQDCLHYCLPGPIDHWVVFFGALLRYAHDGGALF